MVETRSQRSAAAAGSGSGGGGSDGGRGKHPASSASTTKRGKDEAPEQETSAASAAAGKSSGPAEANMTGQPVPKPSPHPQPQAPKSPEAKEAPAAPATAEKSLGPGKVILNGKQVPRPRPWARLLSQHPEISHFHIYAGEISIGRDVNCHMFLGNQAFRGTQCMLRRLQQGGSCELDFTGENGLVVLNEKRISPGDKVSLIGGDELIFGAKVAYIFQHPLRDTEVTKAVQISAVNSADTEPSRWITFKDRMKHGILNPNDIDVTLDNFPYYLSEITKKILLSPAFIHSKNTGITFPKILSLHPRILLSGPSGSETYQETLVKALAQHSEARLLIADSLTLGSSSLEDARMDDVPCTSGDIEGPSNLNTFREGDRVEYTGTAFKLKQR